MSLDIDCVGIELDSGFFNIVKDAVKNNYDDQINKKEN